MVSQIVKHRHTPRGKPQAIETTPDAPKVTNMGVQLKETNEPLDTKDFSFRQWLEENEARKAAQKIEKKHLSLTWRHLSVTGVDSRTVLGHDVLSCVNPMELVSDARGSVDDIVRFGSPRHESILTPTDYFTRPNWTSEGG